MILFGKQLAVIPITFGVIFIILCDVHAFYLLGDYHNYLYESLLVPISCFIFFFQFIFAGFMLGRCSRDRNIFNALVLCGLALFLRYFYHVFDYGWHTFGFSLMQHYLVWSLYEIPSIILGFYVSSTWFKCKHVIKEIDTQKRFMEKYDKYPLIHEDEEYVPVLLLKQLYKSGRRDFSDAVLFTVEDYRFYLNGGWHYWSGMGHEECDDACFNSVVFDDSSMMLKRFTNCQFRDSSFVGTCLFENDFDSCDFTGSHMVFMEDRAKWIDFEECLLLNCKITIENPELSIASFENCKINYATFKNSNWDSTLLRYLIDKGADIGNISDWGFDAFQESSGNASSHKHMKVFISYSRNDISRVEKLVAELVGAGHQVWFDKEILLPGQDWPMEISKQIELSDIFITCLSSQSLNKKGYFHAELKQAYEEALKMPEGQVYILPIRLDECSIPYQLKKYHVCDLYEEKGLDSLLSALSIYADQKYAQQ